MEAGKQLRRGFVGAGFAGGEGVFGGDEFASEGFAEERLREAVDVRLSLRQPGLDLVREREQLFDATHDFLLLGQRVRSQTRRNPYGRRHRDGDAAGMAGSREITGDHSHDGLWQPGSQLVRLNDQRGTSLRRL